MFNQRTTLPSLTSVAVGGFWLWGVLLMFRVQMTKTSNPKHGCVVGTRASVHCQAAGLLTDDAPDSSSSPPHAFRPRPTHPTAEHGWVEAVVGGIIHRRYFIEYVTNTLRMAVGNQIKRWIIYKDTARWSDRAERGEEYTSAVAQTTLQVWWWHFPL